MCEEQSEEGRVKCEIDIGRSLMDAVRVYTNNIHKAKIHGTLAMYLNIAAIVSAIVVSMK